VSKYSLWCNIRSQEGMDAMVNRHESGDSAEVRTGSGQLAYKRRLAYRALGITPEEVECVPFLRTNLAGITRLLNKRCADNEPPVRLLDLLEYTDDPEARKVLRAYLSVPESYRKVVPAEAFCLAARVSPWRILEVIAGVAVRRAGQGSALIAAIQHPSVVAKTINRALESDGVQDRMTIHKAMGFLPIRG
jgi:hypothetical protein